MLASRPVSRYVSTMRLTSEFWVKAYVRRCSGGGAFAVVARHGDDRSGAIFIKINLLDGMARLLGPAPAGMAVSDDERRFSVHVDTAREAECDAYMKRQLDYDADLWLIEIEDRLGRDFLD